MKKLSQQFEDRSFIVLLVLVSIVFLWMLYPFFHVIFWAIVIGLLNRPFFLFLQQRWQWRPSLAALGCVLVSLGVIILPCVYLLLTCVQELGALYQRLSTDNQSLTEVLQDIERALPSLTDWLRDYGYGPDVIKAKFSQAALHISGFIASRTVAIGSVTVSFLIDLTMVLYLAFFLIRDGNYYRSLLIRALPFGDHREELLFEKFAEVMRATVKGSVLVAAAQGALGGVIFAFLGISAPVLWGVVMMILSLIPLVGASLVWLPVAIYLLLTEAYGAGILLIAYGSCVIGLADNILRPILVGRDTKLPDFLVLLSTLGGFMFFGMNGFVSGPLLAVLFVTVWKIFMEEFQSSNMPHENESRL